MKNINDINSTADSRNDTNGINNAAQISHLWVCLGHDFTFDVL